MRGCQVVYMYVCLNTNSIQTIFLTGDSSTIAYDNGEVIY